jgi:2-polyprenyl-3-methyl-5-hydroxy-6-metoxy-1,4-benzoquinol methylase
MHEPLEARLRRLEEERADADRRYNDALTAFDRSLSAPGVLPEPPVEYDERLVPPLNEAWNILPAPPAGAGVTRRLTGFVWRTVGAFFERQLTFNSRLVDHLNRNVRSHRETQRATVELIAALREHADRQAAIEATLVQVLQRITPLLDTKARAEAETFNAALSATADTLGRRWEDLRNGVGMAHQAALTVKRELERARPAMPAAATGAGGASGDLSTGPESSRAGSGDGRDSFSGRLDAYKYVGFEDRFRGSRDAIRAAQESYLPLFEGRADVLDVGCGRGEFLGLLASRGIGARGLDLNPEMVEVCRAGGFDATVGDVVTYLATLQDGSLGGLFSAQVVEHLQPAYLLRFLELAFHKIAPGGPLVLETINPTCWVAFFESYIRDITHVWPLHPETLRYLVMASGFPTATIEFRAPVPDGDRLQPLDPAAHGDPRLQDIAATFNGNMEKLNVRIFSYQDYAVVAIR